MGMKLPLLGVKRCSIVSTKDGLKCSCQSSTVKISDYEVLDLYLLLRFFQKILAVFFAISHKFLPSFILYTCLALCFMRLYFVRADMNLCLFFKPLCLKNEFLACLNSF